MRVGGVAQALVNLAIAWLGGLRGSLGLVTVVSCTLFAAICGSSVATGLAMGTILVPAMIERGYPRSFALGVVGASGTIGIVVPPSLALILRPSAATAVSARGRPDGIELIPVWNFRCDSELSAASSHYSKRSFRPVYADELHRKRSTWCPSERCLSPSFK
jgi:Tripartite ATP-independent periplasmic transporter, DctM component